MYIVPIRKAHIGEYVLGKSSMIQGNNNVASSVEAERVSNRAGTDSKSGTLQTQPRSRIVQRSPIAAGMRKIEPREHVIDQALANGDREAWKQVLGFPAELTQRVRFQEHKSSEADTGQRIYLMGSTWESLLQALVDCRDGDYRSDPERDLARRDNLEWIVQTMLEKLRDAEEFRLAPLKS